MHVIITTPFPARSDDTLCAEITQSLSQLYALCILIASECCYRSNVHVRQ